MQNALLSCIFLSIGCAPIGVFLQLRKMSLVGEALSHGIFPGLVISYVFFGASIFFMMFFGCIAGLLVVFIARFITKVMCISEDNAFASVYIIFLAIGNMVLSLQNKYFDISCFLFGSIFGIDSDQIITLFFMSFLSLMIIIYFYNGMIISTFDENILYSYNNCNRHKSVIFKFNKSIFTANPEFYHGIFYVLLCFNIILAFQAFGTILSIGAIVLPGIIARIFCNSVYKMIIYSIFISCFSQYFGLIMSYYFDLPASSTIILSFGCVYCICLLCKIFKTTKKSNKMPKIICMMLVFLNFFSIIHQSYANNNADENSKNTSNKILCTFSIIEDIVKNIIINTPITTSSIIPNNCDPHSYDLSSTEMKLLSEADLIIVNGLELEKFWLKKILKNSLVINASDGIFAEYYDDGTINPHAWLSVKNVMIYVRNISSALIKKYPQYESIFQKNTAIYIKKLSKLYDDLQSIWIGLSKNIGKNMVIFFSNGDLCGYYAKENNIKIMSIRLVEESNEITPKMIKNFKNHLKSFKKCDMFLFFTAKFDENFAKKFFNLLVNELNIEYKNRLKFTNEILVTDFLGKHSNYIDFMLNNTRILSENIKKNHSNCG